MTNFSLFIKLYLDEDVDILVADLVQARGFDVLTVRDAGLLAIADEEQLEYSAKIGRAIVTHNRCDYEELAKLYFEQGKTHSGIIIAVRRSPYEIARRLLTILNQIAADEIHNQIRYI